MRAAIDASKNSCEDKHREEDVDISNDTMAMITASAKQLDAVRPQLKAVEAMSTDAFANVNHLANLLKSVGVPSALENRFTVPSGTLMRLLSGTSPATNDTGTSGQSKLATENSQLHQKYASETKARQALESENAKLRSEVEQLRKLLPPPEPCLTLSEQLVNTRKRVASDIASIARIVDALEVESRMAEELRDETPSSISPISGWDRD